MDAQIERVFEYEGFKVRTIIIDGEPWFVAADVCTVLELSGAPGQHLRRLDGDEKGVISIHTPGGPQQMLVVNEPGLYSLIMASRKTEAKAFRRWIAHEVIPAIRKTGSYTSKPVTAIEALQQSVAILAEHDKRLTEVEGQTKALTDTTQVLTHRVNSLDAINMEGDLRQQLTKMVNKLAFERGISFSKAWHLFYQAFNTAHHANLKSRMTRYSKRVGRPKSVTGPMYLEETGLLPDAIRVADKLLNVVRKAAG